VAEDGRKPETLDSRSEPNDPGFPARLNELFERYRNPRTGRPYSHEHVTHWISHNNPYELSMSHAHLSHLRRGRADPRLREIVMLARFFQVEPIDLVPAASWAADLKRAAEFRQHGVKELALRQLTDEFPEDQREHVLSAITGVLEAFEKVQSRAVDSQSDQ
jgi:hypothetical protein